MSERDRDREIQRDGVNLLALRNKDSFCRYFNARCAVLWSVDDILPLQYIYFCGVLMTFSYYCITNYCC